MALNSVGSWSVTTTLPASEGPALVTVIRYWPAEPATGGPETSALPTARSAAGATGVELVDELSAGVSSSSGEATVAVLSRVAPP